MVLKVAVRLVARALAGGWDNLGCGDAPGVLDPGPAVAGALLGPAGRERLGLTAVDAALPGPADGTTGAGVRAASTSTIRAVTTDFRDVYATLLERVLGAEADRIVPGARGRIDFLAA